MSPPRRTFVVSVHQRDRVVLVEDIRTHQRVRLADLSELGAQIGHWLGTEPSRDHRGREDVFSESTPYGPLHRAQVNTRYQESDHGSTQSDRSR